MYTGHSTNSTQKTGDPYAKKLQAGCSGSPVNTAIREVEI
jgi:hypothetical protein